MTSRLRLAQSPRTVPSKKALAQMRVSAIACDLPGRLAGVIVHPEWLIFTLIAAGDAAAKTGHVVAQEIHPAYRQECQKHHAQQQRNGMRQNSFPGT